MASPFPNNGTGRIQGFKIGTNDEQAKMGQAPMNYVHQGPSTIYMGVFGQPGEYTINVGHVAQWGQVGAAASVARMGSGRTHSPSPTITDSSVAIGQASPAIGVTSSPTINRGEVGQQSPSILDQSALTTVNADGSTVGVRKQMSQP